MRRLFVLLVPSAMLLVPAGAARGEIIERVVAKVNGQIITLSEFQGRQIAAAQAARVDPSTVGQFLRQNNARILQDAIDEILILQRAEDAGLRAPSQYVDEAIESIKKENNLTSEEQFQDALAREGLTLRELRQNVERSIVRRLIMDRDIRPRVEGAVTEAELKAEYDRRKESDFTKPATVSLIEILVPDDRGRDLANELVTKARAGEDFSTLARAHSAAASRANGGDLGEIVEGDMNPDLRRVATALPVGGVSDPLPVEGGFRILKVVAKTAGSTTPYEGAKERLRDRLMMQRFEKEYEGFLHDLRQTAQIELRVREVPLQLTGPIPEGSLLEALEGGAEPDTPPAAPPGPTAASPQPAATSPPAPAAADEEISTTGSTGPERVAPGTAPPASPPSPVPTPDAPRPPER